jgi:hypothetical protein
MSRSYISSTIEELTLVPMEKPEGDRLFGDFASRDRGSRPQEAAEKLLLQPVETAKPAAETPKRKPAGKANFLTDDRRTPDRRVADRRNNSRLTGDRRSPFGRRFKRTDWDEQLDFPAAASTDPTAADA